MNTIPEPTGYSICTAFSGSIYIPLWESLAFLKGMYLYRHKTKRVTGKQPI